MLALEISLDDFLFNGWKLHNSQECDVTEFGIWLIHYLMPSFLRITAIIRSQFLASEWRYTLFV